MESSLNTCVKSTGKPVRHLLKDWRTNMNQIDYENLGSRMKELRIKMKLTQAEVAKALNVTPGYISNVENNRTAMSLRILIYYLPP